MGGTKTQDPASRRKVVLLSAAVVASVIAALVYSGGKHHEAQARIVPITAKYHGHSAAFWYRQLTAMRAQRDWLQERLTLRVLQVRALQRVKLPKPRDVAYAIHLAATVYGVDERAMHKVASCESGHYAFARNGKYRGVFQEGPMFEGEIFGRAGFSVYDPIANALTAAKTVAREGWSQWECRP